MPLFVNTYAMPKPPPDVIAIQETGSVPSQSGYNCHTSSADSGVATLTAKSLTTVLHQIDGSNIDHNLIEILPAKRGQMSIFVLNAYSLPSRRKENFAYLPSRTGSSSWATLTRRTQLGDTAR